MSDRPVVQYLGFNATPSVREYAFTVRKAGVEREFILNIANEAFLSHRARYQDAPAICALRLNAELAAHSNHPPESQFSITDPELDNYRKSHSSKIIQTPYGHKRGENF
jgi:hypothetical protein